MLYVLRDQLWQLYVLLRDKLWQLYVLLRDQLWQLYALLRDKLWQLYVLLRDKLWQLYALLRDKLWQLYVRSWVEGILIFASALSHSGTERSRHRRSGKQQVQKEQLSPFTLRTKSLQPVCTVTNQRGSNQQLLKGTLFFFFSPACSLFDFLCRSVQHAAL